MDVVYSQKMGFLGRPASERILKLLETLGFELFANELLHADSNQSHLVLNGLEEFREHLGGKLAITLLRDIGRGFEVHEMVPSKIVESIQELRDRHARTTKHHHTGE